MQGKGAVQQGTFTTSVLLVEENPLPFITIREQFQSRHCSMMHTSCGRGMVIVRTIRIRDKMLPRPDLPNLSK